MGARVNQPSKIEPPITPAAWECGAVGDNLLAYVVGFDNGRMFVTVSNSRWFREGCYETVRESLLLEDFSVPC